MSEIPKNHEAEKVPEIIKEFTLNGKLVGSPEEDEKMMIAFLTGEIDALPEDITSHNAETVSMTEQATNTSWITTLRPNIEKGRHAATHALRFLKSGTPLPADLVASEEPLAVVKTTDEPIDLEAEVQRPSEREVDDPREFVDIFINKRPDVDVLEESVVSPGGKPTPTDLKAVKFALSGEVSDSIALETFKDQKAGVAWENIRGLKVLANNIVEIRRDGYRPLSVDDIATSAD